MRAYRPERRHRPSHRDPLLSHTLRRLPPASCPPFPPPPTVGGRRAATTTAAARLGSGRGRLAGTVRCGSRQVAAVGAARSAACPATRPPPSTGTPTDGDRGRAAVAWLVTSRRRQWQHRVWGAYHPPPPYVPTDPRKACQLGVAWLRGCSPRRNPPPALNANQRDGRANDPLLPSLPPPRPVPARGGEGGGGKEGEDGGGATPAPSGVCPPVAPSHAHAPSPPRGGPAGERGSKKGPWTAELVPSRRPPPSQ